MYNLSDYCRVEPTVCHGFCLVHFYKWKGVFFTDAKGKVNYPGGNRLVTSDFWSRGGPPKKGE